MVASAVLEVSEAVLDFITPGSRWSKKIKGLFRGKYQG
jgi:hypothetical protein